MRTATFVALVLAFGLVSAQTHVQSHHYNRAAAGPPAGTYYHTGAASADNVADAFSNVHSWGSGGTLFYGIIATNLSDISCFSFYLAGMTTFEASDSFEGQIYETDGVTIGTQLWAASFNLGNVAGSSVSSVYLSGLTYYKVSANLATPLRLNANKYYYLTFSVALTTQNYYYLESTLGAGGILYYMNSGDFPRLNQWTDGRAVTFEIERSRVPIDVNECEKADACPTGFNCVNTYGSFICVDANSGIFCQCPVLPTQGPTQGPTRGPTQGPTQTPTAVPTFAPTPAPTLAPTPSPTTPPFRAPYFQLTDGNGLAVGLGNAGTRDYLKLYPVNSGDWYQHWFLASAADVGLGPGYFIVSRAFSNLNFDINSAFKSGARIGAWERKANQAQTGGQRFSVDLNTGLIAPAGNPNFRVGITNTVQLMNSNADWSYPTVVPVYF